MHLPALQVVVPMLSAPLVMLIRDRQLSWMLTTAASLCAFSISVALTQDVLDGGKAGYLMGSWPAPFGIELSVDSMSALLLLIVTGASSLALIAGAASLRQEIESNRQPLFYSAWLLALAGLCGILVTADAFNIFVFMEISSLASYILIAGGRITAVEEHAERPGQIVIDMGDLAVLPGLVDVQARLPDNTDAQTGPLLLASGVTTLVSDHPEAEHLNTIWSGKDLPGPRLLPTADWPVAGVTSLADSMTPGLDALANSRPARLLGFDDPIARRFTEPQTLDAGTTTVVIGSQPNGLPAGIALHAELRALVAATLTPVQALRAAGVNAAATLGVDPTLGRVATGAVADLVFVDGDPLADVDAALNVVAVVRNGRFFSVAGLIDRARAKPSVE